MNLFVYKLIHIFWLPNSQSQTQRVFRLRFDFLLYILHKIRRNLVLDNIVIFLFLTDLSLLLVDDWGDPHDFDPTNKSQCKKTTLPRPENMRVPLVSSPLWVGLLSEQKPFPSRKIDFVKGFSSLMISRPSYLGSQNFLLTLVVPCRQWRQMDHTMDLGGRMLLKTPFVVYYSIWILRLT